MKRIKGICPYSSDKAQLQIDIMGEWVGFKMGLDVKLK